MIPFLHRLVGLRQGVSSLRQITTETRLLATPAPSHLPHNLHRRLYQNNLQPVRFVGDFYVCAESTRLSLQSTTP